MDGAGAVGKCGNHPGFGNSQLSRLMWDLKIKDIWGFSQVWGVT